MTFTYIKRHLSVISDLHFKTKKILFFDINHVKHTIYKENILKKQVKMGLKRNINKVKNKKHLKIPDILDVFYLILEHKI